MPAIKIAACLLAPLALFTSLAHAAEPAFSPPLYAFQNGLAFGSLQQEAKTLKAMGYAGVCSTNLNNLKERIAAYDAEGLKVLSIYVSLGDSKIAPAIPLLKDRNAIIELTVRKKIDDAAIKEIQDLADLAAKANVQIAFYPHAGFTIATIDPAIKLVEQVDRPNVGLVFNLCHFLKSEKEPELEATLVRAGKKIFAVSTCGADNDGNNWNVLIQPLDQGTFDQNRLFGTLKEIGFQGPVGIQCYAVKGDKQKNLERTANAWKRVLAEVNK